MARDAGYPSNLLKQDQLNSRYGGEGSRNWGGEAWDFLHGWIYDLADWFLQHVRQDFETMAPVTQDAVVVGDAMGIDVSRTRTGGLPWIGKMTSIGAGNAIFIGVALEPKTATLRVKIARSGCVPVSATLLVNTNAGDQISVNPATNKLHVNPGGETTVARADINGNIYLGADGLAITLI